MTFNGGTVLFTDKVKQDEDRLHDLICVILEDKDTKIKPIYIVNKEENQGSITAVFIITLNNTKFSINFKSDPTNNIKAPQALIIKLFINSPETSVQNEINTHAQIGSQTNLMPICPSFLFTERIRTTSVENMTKLGKAFYKLFQNKNNIEYTEFDRQLTPICSIERNCVQDIIIMEFIDCDTYSDFYLTETSISFRDEDPKSFSDEDPKSFSDEDPIFKYSIHNIEITLTYDELKNFYTYYIASILATTEPGFHHSDMHNKNIMICYTKKTSVEEYKNVLPFVIDFGRAGKIEQDELQFCQLHNIEKQQILESGDEYTMYIRDIYIDAKRNKTRIVDHVNSLLFEEYYVDAVLTLSMCINPKSEVFKSMFQSSYGYNSKNEILYTYLYLMNTERKTKYNRLIKQIIENRNELKLALDLEQKLTQQPVDNERGQSVAERRTKTKNDKNPISKKFISRFPKLSERLRNIRKAFSRNSKEFSVSIGGKRKQRKQGKQTRKRRRKSTQHK